MFELMLSKCRQLCQITEAPNFACHEINVADPCIFTNKMTLGCLKGILSITHYGEIVLDSGSKSQWRDSPQNTCNTSQNCQDR